MGERRVAYRIFAGRPEGTKPLVIPTRRWENNIKCILKMWDGDIDWIVLSENRDGWQSLVYAVINLRVP